MNTNHYHNSSKGGVIYNHYRKSGGLNFFLFFVVKNKYLYFKINELKKTEYLKFLGVFKVRQITQDNCFFFKLFSLKKES